MEEALACREMPPISAHEDFKEKVAEVSMTDNKKLRRTCGASWRTVAVTKGRGKQE